MRREALLIRRVLERECDLPEYRPEPRVAEERAVDREELDARNPELCRRAVRAVMDDHEIGLQALYLVRQLEELIADRYVDVRQGFPTCSNIGSALSS